MTTAQAGLPLLDTQQPDLASTKIRVKSAEGQIELISPEEFQKRFGVIYTPRLLFAPDLQVVPPKKEKPNPLPQEGKRQTLQLQFGQKLGHMAELWNGSLLRWLYADRIRSAATADIYLDKVSDTVGMGIFAHSDIQPGELIGEYTGLARNSISGDEHNAYLFDYSHPFSVIDAEKTGNLTRFINHSRCPNSRPIHLFVDDVQRVLLIATKPILKDRQVLFNYGTGYWFFRSAPTEL